MARASTSGPYPRSRATDAFERRVARALLAQVEEGERLLIACSGGPDSTALLVAAARSLGAARVVAGHFVHRLRPAEEGAADRAVVESVAAALGVVVVAGRAAGAPSRRDEEAAREARYRWLARACREAGLRTCATGHTLDDQAETVLLRLVRGAGAGGTAGMSPVAPWPVPARGTGRLHLVRPMLGVTRAEVERYLGGLGIEAAHDRSNDDVGYARNRVRLRVMPELRTLNPRAAEQIAGFAERQRADDEALELWAERKLARIAHAHGSCMAIERRALAALPRGLAARVLLLGAQRVALYPDAGQIEALLRAARRRGQRVALAGGEARSDGTHLRLLPR